jgi:hypothetical protein
MRSITLAKLVSNRRRLIELRLSLTLRGIDLLIEIDRVAEVQLRADTVRVKQGIIQSLIGILGPRQLSLTRDVRFWFICTSLRTTSGSRLDWHFSVRSGSIIVSIKIRLYSITSLHRLSGMSGYVIVSADPTRHGETNPINLLLYFLMSICWLCLGLRFICKSSWLLSHRRYPTSGGRSNRASYTRDLSF